jgi:hypothetical protein
MGARPDAGNRLLKSLARRANHSTNQLSEGDGGISSSSARATLSVTRRKSVRCPYWQSVRHRNHIEIKVVIKAREVTIAIKSKRTMVVTPSPFEWFARQELASLRLQRRFVVGIVLSLIIHALLVVFLPTRTLEDMAQAEVPQGAPDGGQLTVQLNPNKSLLPKAPASAEPPTPAARSVPKEARQPRVTPPRVLAAPKSANPPFQVPIAPETPQSPQPPVATAPPPTPTNPTPPTDAPPTDMASLVAQARARRGERESSVAGENANARSSEQLGRDTGAAALARNLQSISNSGEGHSPCAVRISWLGQRHARQLERSH